MCCVPKLQNSFLFVSYSFIVESHSLGVRDSKVNEIALAKFDSYLMQAGSIKLIGIDPSHLFILQDYAIQNGGLTSN